jgi:hypothetical protein
MGRLRKPKGPRRVDGKTDYPDMFDWAWARAIPATLDALLGDVSAVSVRASPGFFLAFLTIWLTLSDSSALKPVLGLATLGTSACAGIALFVRARLSRMNPSTAIAWHSVAVAGVAAATVLVVASGLRQDWVRSSAQEKATQKVQADEQAAKAAAEEVQRQAAKAQVAAARALAARDEAAQEAERAVARMARVDCERARDDAIDKATQAYESARRGAEDCRARYNEQLISLSPENAYCKGPFSRLDGARWQLGQAKGRTCDDISTGSVDKPKK